MDSKLVNHPAFDLSPLAPGLSDEHARKDHLMYQARAMRQLNHGGIRSGLSRRGVVITLAVLMVVSTLGWSFLGKRAWPSQEELPLMQSVEQKEFIHEITERGSVESASNVEIVSRVKSQNMSGTAILTVVPEGTIIKPEDCLPEGYVLTYRDLEAMEHYLHKESSATQTAAQPVTGVSQGTASSVEKADNSPNPDSGPLGIAPEALSKKMVLVTLDSSSLKNNWLVQKIAEATSQASVIQAQSALNTAKIAKDEYELGTHEEEKLTAEIKRKEAEVTRSQAEQYLNFSKELARRGYVAKVQLRNDETELEKARNAEQLAQKQMEVLAKYKRNKMLNQLKADIDAADAKLAAAKASHDLDVRKLRDIEEQIANCTIFATKSGQVVYANREGHRGDDEVVIEPGTVIRERQTIIRLPDPNRMQVKARINEAKISLVEVGQPVSISLESFPDLELHGVVDDVGEYPAPSFWMRQDIKEYETIIKILDPPASIRPGLTAQVRIRVEKIDNAVQVPVQTVFEHGGRQYCVLHSQDGFKAQEVQTGSTNDKFVVIKEGLRPGEQVVLNVAAYRDKVDLPQLAPDPRAKVQSRGLESRQAEPIVKQGDRGKELAKGVASAGELMQRLDKNRDEKLDKDELQEAPEQFRSALATADGNRDGSLDRSELTTAIARAHSGNRPRGVPGNQP